MVQSQKEELSLSALQEKILQFVCTKEDVTYKMLIEETKRDRITILQSIESLIKRNFIKKQKSNPEYEKSKLIFKPTLSGKNHAVFILKVDFEDILKSERDEDIANYLEFIKDITDPLQRKMLVQPLSELYTSLAAMEVEGKLPQQFKKKVLREALKKGILETIQKNNNYSATHLLNERSIKWLKKLLTPIEIKELEDFLVTIRDNLSKTIERFPD
jgi:DNA-binding MarR family transcriptional regulator